MRDAETLLRRLGRGCCEHRRCGEGCVAAEGARRLCRRCGGWRTSTVAGVQSADAATTGKRRNTREDTDHVDEDGGRGKAVAAVNTRVDKDVGVDPVPYTGVETRVAVRRFASTLPVDRGGRETTRTEGA